MTTQTLARVDRALMFLETVPMTPGALAAYQELSMLRDETAEAMSPVKAIAGEPRLHDVLATMNGGTE